MCVCVCARARVYIYLYIYVCVCALVCVCFHVRSLCNTTHLIAMPGVSDVDRRHAWHVKHEKL